MNKLASLDTFMRDISTGLDAEVPEGPEGKDNLMKVYFTTECGDRKHKKRFQFLPSAANST